MNNLHKKISAVLLAAVLLIGGSLANGSMVHASFIANQDNFVLGSKEFKHKYEKMIADEISKGKLSGKDIEDYENMIEEIRKAVKDLKVEHYFKLDYVAIPSLAIENLCRNELNKKGYDLKSLKGSFISPSGVVNFLYSFQMYQQKYLKIEIKKNNKFYSFIFYVE